MARIRTAAAGFAATFLIAAAAAAQTAPAPTAPTCVISLPETGKPITLSLPLDEPTRRGLSFSLINALGDEERSGWPEPAIAEAPPCVIETLQAAGRSYALSSGGEGKAPLRWAIAEGAPRYAYLAASPSIEEGYRLDRSPPAQGASITLSNPHFALVIVSRRSFHQVVRLYDGFPPAATLKADMVAGLEGRLEPIVQFDPGSSALSFSAPTQSSQRAVIPPPLPGQGGNPARLVAPDGTYFAALPQGGVRMEGPGFECAPSVGAYRLEDFTVFDATEDGRDLMCRFFGETSWISLYVTRYPDNWTSQMSFDDSVNQARRSSPESEAAPAPVREAGARPAHARAWTDPQGRRQAVLTTKMGPWHVKARVTYMPADHDRVTEAVAKLHEAALRTVGASRL